MFLYLWTEFVAWLFDHPGVSVADTKLFLCAECLCNYSFIDTNSRHQQQSGDILVGFLVMLNHREVTFLDLANVFLKLIKAEHIMPTIVVRVKDPYIKPSE